MIHKLFILVLNLCHHAFFVNITDQHQNFCKSSQSYKVFFWFVCLYDQSLVWSSREYQTLVSRQEQQMRYVQYVCYMQTVCLSRLFHSFCIFFGNPVFINRAYIWNVLNIYNTHQFSLGL